MPDKIYLHLLILCGIWSQGIIRSFANEEIKESSGFHVRQKRVISRIPSEDETVPNSRLPYIVKIKQYMRINCAGSILSKHVVVTAAICVALDVPQYYVLSGAARLDKGTLHTVIDIKTRFGNHPLRPSDGIALLTVDPPFEYGRYIHNIPLHSGPLLPDALGIISGWGFNGGTSDRGTRNPRGLRSIEVPIMSHRDCVNRYRPHVQISEFDICTFHPQRHCGHLDGGAPLVVSGYLAGVHLWTGPGRDQMDPAYPDVFAVLQHSVYNQWIREHLV